MKLRCEMHVNSDERRVLLVAKENETAAHLALKLTGLLLFWDYKPIIDASRNHPAIVNQEFQPALMASDEIGQLLLWFECGKVATHKLSKLARRLKTSRIVVLKESRAEALQLRETLEKEVKNAKRIEIMYWPQGQFKKFEAAMSDTNHILGETGECMLNVVMNEHIFNVEFEYA